MYRWFFALYRFYSCKNAVRNFLKLEFCQKKMINQKSIYSTPLEISKTIKIKTYD